MNKFLIYKFDLGYNINNQFDKTLDLFEKIPFKPDEVLYSIFYNACCSLSNEKSIKMGNKIYNQMPRSFLNKIDVVNSIISMFMKFGQINIAESLFLNIKNKDLYTYSSMFNGYNINKEPHKSLELFQEMKKENLSIDEPTAILLIGSCSQIGIRSISQNISDQLSHLKFNNYLNNALIDMWVRIFYI